MPPERPIGADDIALGEEHNGVDPNLDGIEQGTLSFEPPLEMDPGVYYSVSSADKAAFIRNQHSHFYDAQRRNHRNRNRH